MILKLQQKTELNFINCTPSSNVPFSQDPIYDIHAA